MTIADSDVLIDFLAGKGEADAVEELLSRSALRTTVISRFDLLSGARNPKELARLTRNGGTLLTRNLRHFERVPGLTLA